MMEFLFNIGSLLLQAFFLSMAVEFSLLAGNFHVGFWCIYGLSFIVIFLKLRVEMNILDRVVALHCTRTK